MKAIHLSCQDELQFSGKHYSCSLLQGGQVNGKTHFKRRCRIPTCPIRMTFQILFLFHLHLLWSSTSASSTRVLYILVQVSPLKCWSSFWRSHVKIILGLFQSKLLQMFYLMRLEAIHLLIIENALSSPLIAVQIVLLNTSLEHKSGSLLTAVQSMLLNTSSLTSKILLCRLWPEPSKAMAALFLHGLCYQNYVV